MSYRSQEPELRIYNTAEAQRTQSKPKMDTNKISNRIIGIAIEVHKVLGPGLLESSYEECLCHELHLNNLSFARQ